MKVSNIITYFKHNLSKVANEREIVSWAYIAIENILGLNKSDTILKSHKSISIKQKDEIINIVQQLKKNKPIQYVLGTADFYGLKFKVNTSTLIPRPETEELVSWILEDQFKSVLDIGTGTGCIAISLSKHLKLETYALEKNHKALEIAKQNAYHHNVKINFLHKDILNTNELPRVDLIVSNPPYVNLSEIDCLRPNVVNYEPHDAIFVRDENPLIFYMKITKLAQKFLNKNGNLFFEINEKYFSQISQILSAHKFVDITLKKDINDRPRMIKASKK